MISRKNRDSEDEPRGKMVPLDARVSPEMDAEIDGIAEYERVKASEIIRQFLREGIARFRKDPDYKKFRREKAQYGQGTGN